MASAPPPSPTAGSCAIPTWRETGNGARYPVIPYAGNPVHPRSGAVPESALWRRVPRALAQVLACLAHRDACPAGGGANVGNRGVQGVLPEVVRLNVTASAQAVRGLACSCPWPARVPGLQARKSGESSNRVRQRHRQGRPSTSGRPAAEPVPWCPSGLIPPQAAAGGAARPGPRLPRWRPGPRPCRSLWRHRDEAGTCFPR